MGNKAYWLILGMATGQAPSLGAHDYFYDPDPHHICGEAWKGEFTLDRSVTARVEIKHVRGTKREHKGEARFWIDDLLLGPLRREYSGGTWTHPRALSLSAGTHRLEIECGEEPFEIEGVRVWDGVAAGHRPAAISPAPAPQSRTTPSPCGNPALNTQWPGNPKRAIILSVVGHKAAATGELATLKSGETLRWWFKVAPRPAGKNQAHPPLLLKFFKEGTLHHLQFTLDDAQWKNALMKDPEGLDFPAFGYRRGKWNPLDLTLCPGQLLYSLSEGEIKGSIPVEDLALPLEIQAKNVEISVKGAL